jgi:hypothetical protein
VLGQQRRGPAELGARAQSLEDAQEPYVGRSPIAPVERPMTNVVRISVSRRPILSPRCPKSAPPIGRTANATPNVANATSVPEPAASSKNRSPNTSAAAVP